MQMLWARERRLVLLNILDADRLFTKRGNAESVPQAFFGIVDIIVGDGGMRRYPVVPDGDSAVIPSHAHLTIG